MDVIYTYLDLDFSENYSTKSVPIVQGDDGGRIIVINLYNRGDPVSVNAENDTITISAEVDGTRTVTRKSVNIETVEGTGTRAVIPITSDLSRLSGVEHCVLRISSSNGIVHAAAFDLLVLHNPLYSNNNPSGSSGGFQTIGSVLSDLEIAVYLQYPVSENPSLEESSPYIMIPAAIRQGSYEDGDYFVSIAQNDTILDPENDYNVGDVVGIPDAGEHPSIHYNVRIDFNMAFGGNDTINIIVKWGNE